MSYQCLECNKQFHKATLTDDGWVCPWCKSPNMKKVSTYGNDILPREV